MEHLVQEKTAVLPSYTFFTRDVDQYKNASLSQFYQPPKTPFSLNTLSLTNYFCPMNIAKFLRTAFLQNTSRSSRLQMFFKIGVLKSFPNFTGKHLSWSLFLKTLQAEGLQLYFKKSPIQVFSCEVCKIFRNTFFQRKPPVKQ